LRGMITFRQSLTEEALEKAQQLNPGAAEPHFGRAIRLGYLSSASPTANNMEALKEIDQAIANDPTQVDYWFEKWSLLDGMTFGFHAEENSKIRGEKICSKEEFLQKPYGTG